MYRARYCVGNGMTLHMEKLHRCLPQKVNCHDPMRETPSFEFCVVYFYKFTSTSNSVVLIKQSWLVWPFCKVHPPQRWCFSHKKTPREMWTKNRLTLRRWRISLRVLHRTLWQPESGCFLGYYVFFLFFGRVVGYVVNHLFWCWNVGLLIILFGGEMVVYYLSLSHAF